MWRGYWRWRARAGFAGGAFVPAFVWGRRGREAPNIPAEEIF